MDVNIQSNELKILKFSRFPLTLYVGKYWYFFVFIQLFFCGIFSIISRNLQGKVPDNLLKTDWIILFF